MRGLHLLIELSRRTADERRGILGQASLAKADADAALALHEDGIANESRIAANDPAIMATLGAWSNHAVRERAILRARHAESERAEGDAREALRSAFIDLKRLEMARDTIVRQERVGAMRRADRQAEETYAFARSFAA